MKMNKKKLMNDIKRGQVGKEKCKKRNTKEDVVKKCRT